MTERLARLLSCHATAARKYRGDCLSLLRSQNIPRLNGVRRSINVELTFCPPTKRLADLDNLLSRTKQGIDALAEIIGIDDRLFEYTLRRGDPVKHGKVVVSIGEIA
jgi:crossover junction endodeoxyribonuclease RusA